jgi:uncharacterized protein DUF664
METNMDEALRVVIEMTERVGQGFRKDLEGITPDEAEWRPLPQANNITLIVRHLAIEAEWHRAGLERGEPMPYEMTGELQRKIDAVPFDLERNLAAFEEAYSGFLATLRGMTLADLRERIEAAYRGWPPVSDHFLGFHQTTHVSTHRGQIRTIRNLYQKSLGQPARFVPENPTFPKPEGC